MSMNVGSWVAPSKVRTVALAALVSFSTAACGGDGEDSCSVGEHEDGTFTFEVGELCLENVSVSARVDGAWQTEGISAELEQDGDQVLVTLVGPAGSEALQLFVPELEASRMLQQGFQSWSFSAATLIPAEVPLNDDGAPLFQAAGTGDVFDEEIGVSYGSAVVGPEGGPYLAIGSTASHEATTGVAAVRTDDDGKASLSVMYGATREPLPSESGQARSAQLFFGASIEPNDGLRALSEAIGRALPADARQPERPPGGWFSWNEKFSEIDLAYIQEHIAVVQDQLAGQGLDLLMIDDGWALRR